MIVLTGTTQTPNGSARPFGIAGLPAYGLGNGVGRPVRGMGMDCPSYAPYINSYGNCTNTPPSSSSTASAGGASQILPYNDPSSPDYGNPERLPSGWVANTWTGVAERVYVPNDYGAIETNSADADLEGRAAMTVGASKGVNVVCRTVLNQGAPGFPGLFQSLCTVNGSGEHDAGLLAAAGGIESALMEDGRAAGNVSTSVPFLRTSTPWWQTATPEPVPAGLPVNTVAAPPARTSERPSQAVARTDQTTPMPSGTSNSNVGPAMARTASAVNSVFGTVQDFGESSGIGTTGLLIAAGVALYFLTKK